jgi:hypothetical protein
MDPALKSAVETAVTVLSRNRGGPDGVVAAAAAIESVRRALEETHAASFALRPRIPLDATPELLLTQRPLLPSSAGTGGAPLASPASATSSSGAGGTTPTARSSAAVSSIVRDAAFAYDRAAAALLERIDKDEG